MTTKQFTITAELYWAVVFPGIQCPNHRIIGSWSKYYSIEQVTDGIDAAALYIRRKGITDPVAVSKIVSNTIRRMDERRAEERTSYGTAS